MELDELKAELQAAEITPGMVETLHLFGPQCENAPIYGFNTTGADAVSTWLKLRASVAQTGYWPIIIGEASDQAHLMDGFYQPPQEWLAAAQNVNAEEWLREQAGGIVDPAYRDNDKYTGGEESLRRLAEDATGGNVAALFTASTLGTPIPPAFPSDDVMRSSVAEGYGQEPNLQVLTALVPTRDGAEVPAYLGFGDWNNCPSPEVHIALLRRWNQIYGAEPFAISGDVIEMRVFAPPSTPDAALSLALEQYLYCEDIVEQGTQTVCALAQTLQNSPYWFFWWD